MHFLNRIVKVKFLKYIFLLLPMGSFCQANYNLCGIWLGYGYQCEHISPSGMISFYNVPLEVISIDQNGDSVNAIKLIGDSCVPAGNSTWYGHYTDSVFFVLCHVGAPNAPAAGITPAHVSVVDSAYLVLKGTLIYYKKATCKQIDSLGLSVNPSYKACNHCLDSAAVSSVSSMQAGLEIPNVFTPNSDGINEYFSLAGQENIVSLNVKIFNRWGNEVFRSGSPLFAWNGTNLNTHDRCPEGVYYYVIEYSDLEKNAHKKSGFISLLR